MKKMKSDIYTFTNTWNSLKHCTAMLTKKYVHIKSNLYFKSLGTSSQKHNTIYIMNVIFISFKTPLPPPLLHRGKPYPVPPTTTKYKNIPTIHSSAFNSKKPNPSPIVPMFQCVFPKAPNSRSLALA